MIRSCYLQATKQTLLNLLALELGSSFRWYILVLLLYTFAWDRHWGGENTAVWFYNQIGSIRFVAKYILAVARANSNH